MDVTIANVEMAAAWDGDEGEEWAHDWERYDRAVVEYQRRLERASALTPGERVLDVGCGNGESTRVAGRATSGGAGGTALGVDLSTAMVARARDLAAAEGLVNVAFERADAQTYPFEAAYFDAVISRFGTMFFADRSEAFANLARALRPGGRLVMIGWQGLARQEWLGAIRAALAQGRDLPSPPDGGPGPFGLAQDDVVCNELRVAGFDDVEVEALEVPFWLGRDAADAYDFFGNSGFTRAMLQHLDEESRRAAHDALHQAMLEHETTDGVCAGSAGWLYSARRA